MTAAAICLGWFVWFTQSSRRQASFVAEVESLGGSCFRVYSEAGHRFAYNCQSQDKLPWGAMLLGNDYYLSIPYVDLSNPAIDSGAILGLAKQMQSLVVPTDINNGHHYIYVHVEGNPNVSAQLVRDMHQSAPIARLYSKEIVDSGLAQELYASDGDRPY